MHSRHQKMSSINIRSSALTVLNMPMSEKREISRMAAHLIFIKDKIDFCFVLTMYGKYSFINYPITVVMTIYTCPELSLNCLILEAPKRLDNVYLPHLRSAGSAERTSNKKD